MEHSSPVSKIVATATTSAWAQAYSAGKLHLVISLTGTSEEPIASIGKDTLEKLQREFFALDEKTLAHLKKAVGTVTQTIPEGFTTSLVLTTIVDEVLYIVIFNSGSVLLKRDNTTTIIGAGEAGEIVGFSGPLEPGDIVLVATAGLLETVSPENVAKSFETTSPHEVSENLAPFLHSSATGTEAGLVWNMIGTRKPIAAEEEPDAEHPNDTLDLEDTHTQPDEKSAPSPMFAGALGLLKGIHLPSLKHVSRKQLIIIAAVILVIILVGSIFYEKSTRDNKKQEQEVEAILAPNKQKYDDAIALMSLNKSLAVEELSEVKNDIESKKSQFPQDSNAAKTLDTFLAQVNSALGGDSQTGASQINVFFDATKNSDIPNVSQVTAKGGEIAIIGSTKGGFLQSDGTITSTFNGASSINGLTADEKNAFVLTAGTVEQITKSDGSADTIIEKQASPVSIDTFGGNIYLLSSTDKTIYKYRPSAFAKESYFTGDTKLENPTSFTIDSSVYVIDSGSIKKFTRGAADTFSYKGKSLSSGSKIYTDIDYLNLYVLDPTAKTATVLDKSGNVVTEVSLKGMKNSTSIAADEKAKKMYIVADNKVYSVDH